MMTSVDLLTHLCDQYQQAIAPLMESIDPDKSIAEQAQSIASTWDNPGDNQKVLKLLTTRDRIQYLIDEISQHPSDHAIPLEVWSSLSDTDTKLYKNILPVLGVYEPFKQWYTSTNPSDRHWWWFPESPKEKPDPLIWLWGGLTIALLTVSIALAQDIASRFLTGAPGVWSSIGAIAPVALALFASGGALTKVGQRLFESILSGKGLKQQYWPRLKFILAGLLMVGLLLMHNKGLPHFARNFNHAGEAFYENGQWASAQNHFERALSLEPDLPNAQFNLGVIYEEYQQTDKAQEQYLKAVQANYLPAYNNLARLYIQAKEYDEAAQLLRLALSHEQLPDAIQQEPYLEYVLHKNLGWVRLKQERYVEAETELNEAIRLNKTLNVSRPDAHCLLAQVLHVLDAEHESGSQAEEVSDLPIPETARDQWTQCLKYANRPEYDAWEGMARTALAQNESSPTDQN